MWATRAEAALQAQIIDLQKRLDRAQDENRALLDRLLQKNNVAPVSESPKSTQPVIEVISPSGAVPPEMQDAVRDSWVQEEADYVAMTQGLDADRARQEAMKRFTEMYATGMRQ
jgi:hypothetical protein